MQLQARQEFSLDPYQTFQLVTNPAFLKSACQDLGTLEQNVEITGTGSPLFTLVKATIATPTELVTFAGPQLKVRQAIRWDAPSSDGSRPGALTLEVDGFPVRLDAQVQLAPSLNGSAITYEGELKVSVPLLGPTIERLIKPFITDVLVSQEGTAKRWISERG